MARPSQEGQRITRSEVLRAVGHSVFGTAVLVARGRLRGPADLVGQSVGFADGTTSMVFRETAVASRTPTDPAVLVVQFRLRWIGSASWTHRVFRTTCRLNTPLFAGFPGFVSKLWMFDADTTVYRGLYQWDGARQARDYAERLRKVLLLVCVPASIEYQVIPGAARSKVLTWAASEKITDGARPTGWLVARLGSSAA